MQGEHPGRYGIHLSSAAMAFLKTMEPDDARAVTDALDQIAEGAGPEEWPLFGGARAIDVNGYRVAFRRTDDGLTIYSLFNANEGVGKVALPPQ